MTAPASIRTIDLAELPGCQPYTHHRVMRVRQAFDNLTLIEFLSLYHPPTLKSDWERWIDTAAITLNGERVSANQTVSAGQRFEQTTVGVVEPEVARRIEILHEDKWLLVVDKPAPMAVHPSGRFNRNTLTELLKPYFPGETLRVAHRLDANTQGVMVLCRTREAASIVQPQFEQRTAAKQYIAHVKGTPTWHRHACQLPICKAAEASDASDTIGARIVDPDGQPAHTDLEVLEKLDNGDSLVQASPITGRTNQIRVHLWALGHPILGDPLYLPGGQLGTQQTLSVEDPCMRLRAQRLTIRHPSDGSPVTYESRAAFR
ncbi:RluA family pseudouridine synthase [Neorhodopirellula lusitana]|uniref:RluA family pseudouridine synthase n=1 Tax=Neorhodopirellula lusitana TaxID=445327 RepID=UPI00384A7B26